MKTGSWFRCPRGVAPVRVSIGVPRSVSLPYAPCLELAPTWEMVGMAKRGEREEYYRLYRRILARHEPKRIWDEIHERAERLAPGAEPVLLCWERPPFHDGNSCHRRAIAEWFMERLGESVPEIGVPGSGR